MQIIYQIQALRALFLGNGGLSCGSITCTWWFTDVALLLYWVDFPDALMGLCIVGKICFLRFFVESSKL